jgi:DNA repair exonuclease SbcCD nuclease subunit
MFKFIHAADVHLDSPFVGLERYEGAPVERMRQATRRALENLVQLALDEQVKFVLIAGDLYDRDWRDYRTGLFFVKQMNRLRQANIRIYGIAGNHDAANKMTKILRLQAKGPMDEPIMLWTDKPETRFLKDLDVAIHGQGFGTEAVNDDLSASYPAAEAGCFNIGLLHTCANCDGHARYAPCTMDGLIGKQYDYWALGHIHKCQILKEEPHIVFPGNVQGRNIRETGPKGCMLVIVHDNRSVETEFRCLDVLRWEVCAINAGMAVDPEAALSLVVDELGRLRDASDGRALAVRVEIKGASLAHDQLQANPQKWINEIRSLAVQIGADELWIEKVKFCTAPPLTNDPLSADGPITELLNVIEQLQADPGQLQSLMDDLAELERKLPQDLKDGSEAIHLDSPAWLHGVLAHVRPILVNRLLSRGVPR